ncbi:MAG: FtsX-like permease family protein, partial [Gammaproteobacteria bacterium]
MRTKALGFDQEQLIVIHRANALGDQLDPFIDRIKQDSSVISAAASVHVPGENMNSNALFVEGRSSADIKIIWGMQVGFDYVETLGINLIEGRSFNRDFGSNDTAVILNQSAVRELELIDPLNQRVVAPSDDGQVSAQVIGVMEDFHFESLHLAIRPLYFTIDDFIRYVVVRAAPGSIPETIAALERVWSDSTNGQPFEYSFLEEDLNNLYQSDRKMGSVFTGFAVLAVLIACLGLYGLSWYTTEQRTKEIGIRKTLGAPVSRIVLLLSKEFMVLVAVALAIAIPVAWYAMNQWLQLFSYRVEISPLWFVYAGSLAAIIAFVTISYQSARAAL